MIILELLPALWPVVAEFDRLSIAYCIGGSVASSLYGQPRSTLDVDLCASVTESDVRELISKWEHDFYVSESAMRDAIQRCRCFNAIHLATSLKIDVFVRGQVVVAPKSVLAHAPTRRLEPVSRLDTWLLGGRGGACSRNSNAINDCRSRLLRRNRD